MKESLLKEYQSTMEHVTGYNGNIEELMDREDVIQTRMMYLLEHPEKTLPYTEPNHFRKSLAFYIRKKSIRPYQQRQNMVSLNDSENGLDSSILVSVPKDNDLWRYIVTQKQADGHDLFSRRQKQVLSKRYLSGKNQSEIASELNLSQQTVSRVFQAIDSKILGLDIKANVGSWYKGQGNNLPKSAVWSDRCQDTKITHIETGKRIGYASLDIVPGSIGNVTWYAGSAGAGSVITDQPDRPTRPTLQGYYHQAPGEARLISLHCERVSKRISISRGSASCSIIDRTWTAYPRYPRGKE